MLVSKIQRRLDFKKLFKETKDPKYGSLQEMGKDALNGGAYGRLNTKGDWQEDPSALLRITIGCQLEILMIIEALIEENFTITSCNTDGWDAIIPINREKEYFEIVKFYESKIGNSEIGNVEFTQFEWMAQTSVNDYIAKKIGDLTYENGKIHLKESISYKLKGDFEYPKLLHKNTSFSIIPKALYQYFVNDIRPEVFIPENSDIFDFCARSNSGSTYYHKGYNGTSIESFDLPKLIRYYVAKDATYKYTTEQGEKVYDSQEIQQLWKKGQIEFGPYLDGQSTLFSKRAGTRNTFLRSACMPRSGGG